MLLLINIILKIAVAVLTWYALVAWGDTVWLKVIICLIVANTTYVSYVKR